MDVVEVAASTASATSIPPFSAASLGGAPFSMNRKMFSSTTTESSIKREKARAKPPSSMVLIEPPMPLITRKQVSADRGIDSSTAKVARGLPRNSRIIRPVSASPMPPSFKRFFSAVLTKMDWSNTTAVFNESGTSARCFMTLFTPSTIAIVLLSPPCFRMGMYTDRCPSILTMFV